MRKRKDRDIKPESEEKKNPVPDKYVINDWVDSENKKWKYPHTLVLDPGRSPWFRHDFHVFEWEQHHQDDGEGEPHKPYSCQLKKCRVSGHSEKCTPLKSMPGYFVIKKW